MVLLLLGALLTPEVAEAKELKTRIGLLGGGRRNLGDLGERYSVGWVAGAEAGYQPGILGVGWSILWGDMFSSSPANIEADLYTVEMDLSLRAAIPLVPEVLNLTGRAGVDLLRTSIPVEPGPARSHLGPLAGLGLEIVLGDLFLINLSARYAIIPTGPASMTVLLSLGLGAE